jgi:Hsp70 protein
MDLQVLSSDNAKLSQRDVDMVLLVGRASRMPRVRSLLTEFFGRGPSVLSCAVRPCRASPLQCLLMLHHTPRGTHMLV